MYKLDFSHPCSLYFVGIGGISMCCLAELLADAGFRVQGSDRTKSHLTDVLESKGITVHIGQRAQNIPQDVDCAVFTGAMSTSPSRSGTSPVSPEGSLWGRS